MAVTSEATTSWWWLSIVHAASDLFVGVVVIDAADPDGAIQRAASMGVGINLDDQADYRVRVTGLPDDVVEASVPGELRGRLLDEATLRAARLMT
jgi:hypothetical protein